MRSNLTPISLFVVLLTFWVMVRIEFVLILLLFSLLLGTVLERPVRNLQARRIPRPAAIFVIYAAIIGGLVLLGFIVTPMISDQASEFRAEFPARMEDLKGDWSESSNPILNGAGVDLLDRAIEFVEEPDDNGGNPEQFLPVLSSIGTGLIGILTVLVVTFYYLLEKSLIRRVVIQQIKPEGQARANRIWDSVENKVGGWMQGQLLLCLIIGTIATVSYGIIGLSFWPLLGLWAGLTEIIPIVGPWIGGIPAVLVAFTMGWKTTIIVIAVIVGMQTLENWFLVPRVMRGAVGLTPLTVFLAILAGTQFAGPIGAVLAIPIAASLQVIITDWLDTRRTHRDAVQISGWRWMLNRATNRDGTEEFDPPPPAPTPYPRPSQVNGEAAPATSPAIATLDPDGENDLPPLPTPAESRQRWGGLRLDPRDPSRNGEE